MIKKLKSLLNAIFQLSPKVFLNVVDWNAAPVLEQMYDMVTENSQYYKALVQLFKVQLQCNAKLLLFKCVRPMSWCWPYAHAYILPIHQNHQMKPYAGLPRKVWGRIHEKPHPHGREVMCREWFLVRGKHRRYGNYGHRWNHCRK